MRAKPYPLSPAILSTPVVIANVGVAARRLPYHAFPAGWHLMLAIVAAKGYAESRIVPVGNCPLPHSMRNRCTLYAIDARVAAGRVCIRRVKEYSARGLLDHVAEGITALAAADAGPVAAANPHTPQPIR